MKIKLEINNTTKSSIEESFFEAVAEKTFTEVNCDFLNPSADGKEIGISVALVAPEEIQTINKEYRKYDSVTDILSFPEYKSMEDLQKNIQKGKSAQVDEALKNVKAAELDLNNRYLTSMPEHVLKTLHAEKSNAGKRINEIENSLTEISNRHYAQIAGIAEMLEILAR